MGEDTTTVTHDVNARTYNRFISLVERKHRSKYGHTASALEEAMELYVQFHEEDAPNPFEADTSQVLARLGRIEETLQSVDGLERERGASNVSYSQETEDKLQAIVADLPDETTMTEEMAETPIEDHAGGSFKTLKKYKRLLRKRGYVFEHPTKEGTVITGAKTLAIVCEQDHGIRPATVDRIVGEVADRLDNQRWYLEALPDDMVTSMGTDLKYASAVKDGEAEVEDLIQHLESREGAEKGFQ